MNLPTKRSLRKFGRDLLAAMLGGGVLFVTDETNLVELGLDPALVVIAVPIVLYGWRYVRQMLGQEPES